MSKFDKDWMILPNGVRVPRPKRTVHLNEPSIGPEAVSDTESGEYAQTSPSSNELDEILVQLVEDCHGIVMEQFMSVVDKNPAFDRSKARIDRLLLQAQITEQSHTAIVKFQLPNGDWYEGIGYEIIGEAPKGEREVFTAEERLAALTKQMEE